MQYLKLGTVDEFGESNFLVKTVMGKKIAIIRLKNGELHAVESTCKHQGANLLEKQRGKLTSNIISCPRHGWQYDLLSGECLSNDSLPLKIFPAEVRDRAIYVGLDID